LTADPTVAKDLTQETFARAYRCLASYRGDAPFLHWLLRICANLARDHQRATKRRVWGLWERPEQEKDVRAAASSVEYPELVAVHKALAALSPKLKTAVLLFEIEGVSLPELAAQLEVPLHTAASRVRRGREQLRRKLEKMGFESATQAPLAASVELCGGQS
jgi:RNA polymerase sigma-70 factor (ECF subfamily)